MPNALKPLVKAAHQVSLRLVGPREADSAELAKIRAAMVEHIIDCELRTVRRVRIQLENAQSAMQLWLLRSEVYQAVSEKFGQAAAAERVAALKPLFRRFVPEKQLRTG